MTPSELQDWLLSEGIQDDLAIVTRANVFSELGNVVADQDAKSSLENIDWKRLLLAGSVLAKSSQRPHVEAALRIATAAISLSTDAQARDAGTVLLQKLSNYRAVDLALHRHLLEPNLDARLGVSARMEALLRNLDNSILVQHSGEWLQVNRFQQEFWGAASRPQAWISASAPTASGKTFLVCQWLLEEMQTTGARVAVYLAPTRALVSEIEENLNNLAKRTEITDLEVTALPLAAKHADAHKGGKKVIFVLTQERLHLLANTLNDDLLVDLLVADEAHKVGDRLRGVVLQEALERVSRGNVSVKVVFVSPATQNPETLLEDAPASISASSVDSDVPTVLQNVILASQRPLRTTEWLLQLRQSNGMHVPLGTLHLQARPTTLKKKLALIASAAGVNGGTLVYTNGAAEAEEVAFLISQLVPAPEGEVDADLLALSDLAKRGVHESYLLVTLARKGVAFHYGNMPSLLREEIERLFKIGKLRFLVCTSTLIEGVNLSCRTIVVRGPRKGKKQPMEPHDFWNLAGRAGRWGNEFQGNIICVDPGDANAWPDGVPERKRYPIERETDSVLRSGTSLKDFIDARWNLETREIAKLSQLEQVSAYLLALRLREGSITSAPFTKRHDPNLVQLIDAALAALLVNISISSALASRHSAVSAVGLQKLLTYFRGFEGNIEDLLPAPPESEDAYKRLTRIMAVINEQIYPAFYPITLIPLHTLIVLEWLKGLSLAAIIKARIAYNLRNGRKAELPKLIRNTMELIEQTARFRAPKYLSAYMEVMKLHLAEIGRSDLISNDMDVGVALEFGVSTRTLVSLIELGLSRMTAVALHEKIALDNLDKEQARKWIEENNPQFDGMDIPAMIVGEVRRKVLGIAPPSTSVAS